MRKIFVVFTTVMLIMILSTGCHEAPERAMALKSSTEEFDLPIIGPEALITTETEEYIPGTEAVSTENIVNIVNLSTEIEPIESTGEQTTEEEILSTEEITMAEPTTETSEASKYTFTDIEGCTMYITGSVNIRSLPSTEGEIYFVYHLNDQVWVTGKCNETGWYRIDIEGHECYVSNKYVSTEKYVASTASPVKTSPAAGFVYYSIAGNYPNKEYEQYLYNQLSNLGIAWWYPYAVAQIFQESRWNPNATNGSDHGICQFKGIYFAGRAKYFAGMSNANIWNAYDSLKVYAYYIKAVLSSHGNDVNKTLSFYICGDDVHWDQTYINHVMNWYKQLKAS